MSGTSMATPWVAGVVALMMVKHRKIGGKTPLHSVEDVREHLRKTAIELDQVGKDTKTGYGLIDVSKALETLKPEPIPEPVPDPLPEPEPIPDPRIDQLVLKVEQQESELTATKVRIEALIGRVTSLESKLAQIKGILSLESKLAQIRGIL